MSQSGISEYMETPFEGYKGNIFLIVEKVCDCYGTAADPRAQEHEEPNPGLHFTALQSA